MTQENKTILINRAKSLAWRTGAMVLSILVTFIAANLQLFNLPAEVTVFIGLVLGEISKYLNTKTS